MITDKTKLMMTYLYRRERKEKGVTLGEILDWIRNGKYARRVEAVRGHAAASTGYGLASGPLVAADLPRIRPALSERGAYTGLVLLSFRIADGQERLEQLRQTVNVWEQTLMSFVGSSGRSLKVLIPYSLPGGGLPEDSTQTSLFQQYAYKRASEYVSQSTGIRPEEIIHDGSEGFRISHDPKAWLNPDAKAIEMSQPTEPLSETTASVVNREPEPGLDTELLPGYTRREMDITKYNAICRHLAFDRYRQPDEHLLLLAAECRKAGIDQELAIKLTIYRGDWGDKDTLVRSCFENAYQGHRLGTASPLDKSLMHQQLLEAFLKRRYIFRRNKVTGDIDYQEKDRYQLDWRPLTQEVRNDINNAAIREGIKVWPQDLERILVSERISQYDPVREWLDRLPRWDGRDRLGELADRVKTKMPGWRDNFKVWMRSMVSQWRAGHDALYGAQMVLMLVGGQGTRKSTFMRMLLPRELMPFYIDRIDFANKKEALRALSRFLLINIDEYDQISKAQTAFLKHLIQRTDVKERKMYSTMFEQQQRYAAFCATTNSLVPLKDESGSRRYMVVEVTGVIDTDTQGDRRIDYPQLYAQIIAEIESGEEYAFTGEREHQIIERNADYYEVPNVIAIFEDHFRQPQGDDEVLLLSPTEILTRLKLDPKNRSNTTLLGTYLHRNGFEKGKGRQGRRYLVAMYA